jgi:DNA replicative helicase MCM subunit Mcm2 (Cdc46/Mcm family)
MFGGYNMGVLDGTEFDDVIRLQKQLQSSMLEDFELDSKIKVLTIFDEMVGSKKRIQTEKLLIELEHRGMSEFEAVSVIEKLKRDGLLFEPQPGYIQKY